GLAFYTNLAYPVTDLVMLAVVFGAVAARGWRVNAPWALARLGIVAFWIADSHYLVSVDSYAFPDPVDVGWGLCFVFLAASAAAPAASAVTRAQRGRRDEFLPLAFAALSLG